jgi:hypothetical protein
LGASTEYLTNSAYLPVLFADPFDTVILTNWPSEQSTVLLKNPKPLTPTTLLVVLFLAVSAIVLPGVVLNLFKGLSSTR